ncbi:MAG TPA: VWA domain-containing protein [Myxococcota bacterium]|nr:VWA domain-containing protein [Myxococcota bacterium]
MPLSDFHFLRPLWLPLVPAAAALPWLLARRSDPLRRWQGLIDPVLLPHLVVRAGQGARIGPVHVLAVMLGLLGVALAGPTWQRERPPFAQDRAPLVVAIETAASMDAADVSPTRLERVKQKVHDLLDRRAGAPTGLVVWAGSAHVVLPPADDPAVLALFLDALDTRLMPVAGKNPTAALAAAESALGDSAAEGTVLFFADGADADQVTPFAQRARESASQVLLLGVGTSAGGPMRAPDGGVVTDADGRPLRGDFDRAGLERLARESGAPIASVTVDGGDVAWVERRAQRHLEAAQAAHAETRWRESGWALVFPIALLAALQFRRGWRVAWSGAVLAALLAGAPGRAAADPLPGLSWLLTADQQGRFYFAPGEYAEAAKHFADSRWKGIALYRAGEFRAALVEFARGDDAESLFEQANCRARLGEYALAVSVYDAALALRPDFPEASQNRALVAKLVPKPENEPPPEDPNLKPDEVQFDEQGKRGKAGRIDAAMIQQQSAELWMRNLRASPADFLRQKFAIEAEGAK